MIPYIQLTIPTYGIMVALGVFFTLCLAYKRNKLFNFSLKQFSILAVANVIGVITGSKLLFLITKLPKLLTDFSWHNLGHLIITSGFVFYGGLIGTLIASYLCCRIMHIETKKVYNFLTPAFLLFHAFGRVGCFLGGCCYGIECNYGFAMAGTDERRFPVQLLESALNIILLCWILNKEKKKPKTFLLPYYLGIYAMYRFGLEFLRGDALRGIWGPFSTSQWISLCMMIIVAIYSINQWINRRMKYEEK